MTTPPSSLDELPLTESTTPILPCADLDVAIDFYTHLGFEVIHRQSKPYPYLATRWRGVDLHFGRQPAGVEAGREDFACLIAVDAVAPYHAAIARALKDWLGRVPSSGRPRLTRYRQGASRFTLVDPLGNNLIFVQRGEPTTLDYGGSKALRGLAKALDNARILREFRNDDLAAFRALDSALRRPKPDDQRLDRATALAVMVELAPLVGAEHRRDGLVAALQELALNPDECDVVLSAVASPEGLRPLLLDE